jgi:hypothetical protein
MNHYNIEVFEAEQALATREFKLLAISHSYCAEKHGILFHVYACSSQCTDGRAGVGIIVTNAGGHRQGLQQCVTVLDATDK